MRKCPPSVPALFSLSGGHLEHIGHMTRARIHARAQRSLRKDTPASAHVPAPGASGSSRSMVPVRHR